MFVRVIVFRGCQLRAGKVRIGQGTPIQDEDFKIGSNKSEFVVNNKGPGTIQYQGLTRSNLDLDKEGRVLQGIFSPVYSTIFEEEVESVE